MLEHELGGSVPVEIVDGEAGYGDRLSREFEPDISDVGRLASTPDAVSSLAAMDRGRVVAPKVLMAAGQEGHWCQRPVLA